MNPIKRICLKCNKSMPTIGNKRKNGTPTVTDWSGRQYHKKCFNEMIRENPNIIYADRVY